MKRFFISALALLGMDTMANAHFSVVNDGKVIFVLAEGTPDYITFENVLPCGGVIGEAVDMGLSVKWSSVNIGASSPEQSGNYIAWGETEAKGFYGWSTYKYMQSGMSEWYYINKYQAHDQKFDGSWYKDVKYYQGDKKTTLEAKDDVATQSWGSEWRIPTAAEWEELYNNTTQTWTYDYEGTGVNGYILTSTKEGHEGASIFLPAAGRRDGRGLYSEGNDGYYWSSSLNEENSSYGRDLEFEEYNSTRDASIRCYGQSVRPVCPSAE